MAYQIQIRRDTANNWTSVNPVLAQGEWGWEYDTLKIKLGDGISNWNNLPYLSNTPLPHAPTHTDGTDDIQDATSSQKGLATAQQISKLNNIEDNAQVNVNADWNSSSGDSQILNKPTDLTDLSSHSVTELNDVSNAGSGNIITDIERTKLNNIEDGAEVNQTDAEIKIQYENNANTNAFTDAEKSKLSGIEDGAEVNQTDAEIKIQYENNANTNAFTDAEKSKLATLEGSHFLGVYSSLTALQNAHPTASDGDYADVDPGAGTDITRYIWDNDDSKWVEQLGEASELTDAQIKIKYENNPDTNAYTDNEKTKLSNIEDGAEVNVNADWNASSGDAQILNKPTDLTDLSSHSATELNDISNAGSGNIITNTERTKLNGIEDGAEVNVNADWNALSGDAQILNKPTDLTDLSSHSATELNDISDAGSGSIITNTERTKLDGIEDGATADQTKADIEALHIGHDSLSNVGENDHHPKNHTHPATEVIPDTTNFDKNLSSADDTVQKALETLDDLDYTGLIFQFGRNGDTAAGSFYKMINGMTMTSSRGIVIPANGYLVAIGYTRGDTDEATFRVLANGSSIYNLTSTDVKGYETGLTVAVNAGDVISVKNTSASNSTSNVQGWLQFRWRF